MNQDTDNIEQPPIPPEDRLPAPRDDEKASEDEPKAPRVRKKHSLTPVKAMKIEYLHHDPQPEPLAKYAVAVKTNHGAKRDDQLGLLLMFCAVLVVVVVLVILYLNNKNYFSNGPKKEAPDTVEVNFYQGNQVFAAKVAEEKAAKKIVKGYKVEGITTVNENLEVPLSEQMVSMDQKMEKMRTLQQEREQGPPEPDTGPIVVQPAIKPLKEVNFQSPIEFNTQLTNVLQKKN